MSAILPNKETTTLQQDQYPALVYLASLGSDHSRRNMS